MTNLYSATDTVVASGIATTKEQTFQQFGDYCSDVIQDRLGPIPEVVTCFVTGDLFCFPLSLPLLSSGLGHLVSREDTAWDQ